MDTRKVDRAGQWRSRYALNGILFSARDGEPVFSARLSSGIAANPYLRFFVTAKESGQLAFEWVDDNGVRFVHVTWGFGEVARCDQRVDRIAEIAALVA